MEAVEVYSKCKASVYNTKALFNHYEKYHSCASISCLDEKRSDIVRRIAYSYTSLVNKADKALTANNLVLIADEDAMEIIEDHQEFIDHVINHLEKYEDHIIGILNNATEQKKISYLYNFDSSYNEANVLVDKMERMIKNSQAIHQTYYRASA